MSTVFGKVSTSPFVPASGFENKHVQTIWPRYFLNSPQTKVETQRIITPDDDFLDLAWLMPEKPKAIAFVLHGLQGCVRSHYIEKLFAKFSESNIAAVLMHFRGCSGELNKHPRAYHSGDTEDPLFAFNFARQYFPNIPVFMIGYSLGGNAMLKLLSEHKLPISGAVSVSAPIDLASSAETINRGFAKVYQYHLLKSMKHNLLLKMHKIDMSKYISVSKEQVMSMKSFYAFDDKVTAPLHGYSGASDYYKRASAKPVLRKIKTKTLILHAADDPFMDQRVIPEDSELTDYIAYEISEKGGHVGFMQRKNGKLMTFLPDRIKEFIEELL